MHLLSMILNLSKLNIFYAPSDTCFCGKPLDGLFFKIYMNAKKDELKNSPMQRNRQLNFDCDRKISLIERERERESNS